MQRILAYPYLCLQPLPLSLSHCNQYWHYAIPISLTPLTGRVMTNHRGCCCCCCCYCTLLYVCMPLTSLIFSLSHSLYFIYVYVSMRVYNVCNIVSYVCSVSLYTVYLACIYNTYKRKLQIAKRILCMYTAARVL